MKLQIGSAHITVILLFLFFFFKLLLLFIFQLQILEMKHVLLRNNLQYNTILTTG